MQSQKTDCHHEALTAFGSKELPKSDKEYVGSCDTNPLNPVKRDGVTMKIFRPQGEVVASILNAFDNPFDWEFAPFVEGWVKTSTEALKRIDGIAMEYGDLSNVRHVQNMIALLKPADVPSKLVLQRLIDVRMTTMNRNIRPLVLHAAGAYKMTLRQFYTNIVEQRGL